MLRKQLLAVSFQQQESLKIKTVFNINIDFKSKGANFCSKTIKYYFYPKLRAIAEVRRSSGGG